MTVGGQPAGGRRADSGRGAGDDRDASLVLCPADDRVFPFVLSPDLLSRRSALSTVVRSDRRVATTR